MPSRTSNAPTGATTDDASFWPASPPRIERLPLASLRPNPRNARTHSKAQIRKIAASLRAFGFVNPIVADETLTVLAGHGRLEAARLEGLRLVPVVRLDHLTAAQKRAYLLADNKIAEQAGWDRELLAIELEELTELLPVEGLDVFLTGFEATEIDLLLADQADADLKAEDAVPRPPAVPVSAAGDLWVLGQHRLICADARDPAAIDRVMAGRRAAGVFTDPPYNVRVRDIVGRGQRQHDEFAFASGEMSEAEFKAFLAAALAPAIATSRDGAIHFVCMDWRHVAALIDVAQPLYGAMLNLCVWNKSNAGQGSFYRSQHELVGVFRVGAAPHLNNIALGRNGRNRSNVWTYPGINSFGPGRLEALSSHPTCKPVQLVVDALLDCTRKGDVVLDPFMGSGTTVIAAERTGRRACGVEVEPRYVDVAIARWQRFTGRDAVFERDGRTFDEVAAGRGPMPDASLESVGPGAPAEADASRLAEAR